MTAISLALPIIPLRISGGFFIIFRLGAILRDPVGRLNAVPIVF